MSSVAHEVGCTEVEVPNFAFMPATMHALEVAEAVEDRRLSAAVDAAASTGYQAGLAEGYRQAAELILGLPPEVRLGRAVTMLLRQHDALQESLLATLGPKAKTEAEAFPAPRSP